MVSHNRSPSTKHYTEYSKQFNFHCDTDKSNQRRSASIERKETHIPAPEVVGQKHCLRVLETCFGLQNRERKMGVVNEPFLSVEIAIIIVGQVQINTN